MRTASLLGSHCSGRQVDGNVEFGDLGVGDRWADLAVASLSRDWNFGEGHEAEFLTAYGIERDEERIRYYRSLWRSESQPESPRLG